MHDQPKRVILFDGVCGLCNLWVDFILKRDRRDVFRFAPLQGEFANQIDPKTSQSLDSVVYLVSGKRYYRTGAILRILRDLGGIWSIVWLFWIVPYFLRDPLYALLARNRYRIFGKREVCRLPKPHERDKFIEN